jgi:fibronectin-binding autotransporter adhesin
MKPKVINHTVLPFVALLVALLVTSVSYAATYTWRGTNSTVWGTPGNWLAQSVAPTNGNYNHRLDVNNAAFSGLEYTAAEGTTVYGQASPGVRGFVIGSGTLGSGTMTISGGTLITTNGSAGDLIGNSDNNTGTLNISGGTLISGSTLFQIGTGGGVNRTSVLNVNSGSATVRTISINTLRGTINLNGGTLAASNILVSAILGVNATNNFNGGTLKPRNNSTAFFPTVANAVVQVNVRDGGAIIDTDGFNITVAQPFRHSAIAGDAAVDGGLTKNGNGTLTLNGLPTYTGPTVVNAGQLTSPLPTASSSLVVAHGARYTPTLTNAPWFVGSAAATNSTVDFNYVSFSANPETTARIYVTNLAISGSVTCNVAGTGFPVTNVTLLSYENKTGGGSFVLGSVPPGAIATLNDDGTNVTVNFTAGSIQNLIWAGGDGIWQTNGAANWNGLSATYLEYPSGVNDMVTFNDTTFGTVNINSQVNPLSTTVDVTTGFYTFSGAGSIGGTNGIVKTGTSTLQIDNANNFTGPVTISGGSGTVGGTLFVNNPNALGATNGMVTVNGPANTLAIGVPGGVGVAVSNKSVTIIGTGVGGSLGVLRGTVSSSGSNVWAGQVVVGADQARIGTENNGNLTVSGPITDNGANLALVLRPGIGGTLTIESAGSTYGPSRTFGDPNTSTIRLVGNNALSTNRLDHGPGFLDLNGYNQTVAGINENSGAGRFINNGASPSTLTIHTGTNSASTFGTSGDVLDGTSALNIVKSGLGRQTLSGANLTYSGTTTVSGGELNLTTVNPMNTAITVGSGATLIGEITTTNSLTLAANSTLSVNLSTPGSITADTINATASPIKILFTAAPTNGVEVLVLNSVNGISGLAANFQAVGSRGGTFFLTNGNTQLMFLASAAPASLTWKGNHPTNPTFWDTITTTNWSNGGSPDLFYAGDNVLFDNTASSFTVAIQSTVVPASVTVNSATDYNFSGTLGGGGAVTKAGTGTLFLNNNNSYTGPTVITNGTVSIQTSTALGTSASGTTISDTGSLDINTASVLANTVNLGAEVLTISGNGFGGQGAIVNNSPVLAPQINAVQQIVMAGNSSIGGSARWDMRGTGNALDMQATNTLTKIGGNYLALVNTTVNNPGNIVINAGTLGLQVNANLGGSSANSLTVNSGGTLNLYQLANSPLWSLILNGGSTVWGENGGGAQNTWSGPVALNGATTLQADGVLTISGTISGVGSITKTGNATATLSGANSYSGNTTVNAGTLSLATATLDSGSTVTIASNAVLNLNFAATNVVAALVLNGVSQPSGIYDATTGAPFITGTGAVQVGANAPTLNVSQSGNNLDFSWTGSFKLQAQTNTLNIGISTNWGDYPGGGSSPVTVPMDAANGAVFFRLSPP